MGTGIATLCAVPVGLVIACVGFLIGTLIDRRKNLRFHIGTLIVTVVTCSMLAALSSIAHSIPNDSEVSTYGWPFHAIGINYISVSNGVPNIDRTWGIHWPALLANITIGFCIIGFVTIITEKLFYSTDRKDADVGVKKD